MNLDVVVPFYNEEGCAELFVRSLMEALGTIEDLSIRWILVDDGSTDRTPEILDGVARLDPRVEILHLWGNHGHQKALVAGLDRCSGGLVLMLDGDGQHPVDVAGALVRQALSNPRLALVQAVRRGDQAGWWKNASSALFYRLANGLLVDAALRPGASDFRVMRRSALEVVRGYADRHRNLRVLLAALKFPTAYVEYRVEPRLAGSSRYRLRHMVDLAANGIFAFSSLPLRLSLFLMVGSGSVGLFYLLYVLRMYALGRTVDGWASLILFIFFLFSAVFGILAVLSEYIVRIYEDVRQHPVYRLRPDQPPGPL